MNTKKRKGKEDTLMQRRSYMGMPGFSRHRFTAYMTNADGHLPYCPPQNEEAVELLEALIDDEYEDDRSAVIVSASRRGLFHNVSVNVESIPTTPVLSFNDDGFSMYATTCSTYIRDIDGYMGKTSRKGDRIFAMHAIAFDFDSHQKEREASLPAVEKAVEAVKKTLRRYDVEPAAVVFSGRGFHVYIAIESLGANLEGTRSLYRKTCRAIADELEKAKTGSFRLDRATVGDATRLLRVPGTRNTTAHAYCRLLECVHTRRYSAAELLARFRGEKAEVKTEKKERLARGKERFIAQAAIDDIRRTIAARKGELTGSRNVFLMVLSAYGVWMYSEEDALALVMETNQMFSEPLSEKEVLKTFHSGKNYKFSFSAARAYLGLTEKDDPYLRCLISPIAKERLLWLHYRKGSRSGSPLGYTDKQIARAKRNDFILQRYYEGKSADAITQLVAESEHRTCTKRTVYRVIAGSIGQTPTLEECNELSRAIENGEHVEAPVFNAFRDSYEMLKRGIIPERQERRNAEKDRRTEKKQERARKRSRTLSDGQAEALRDAAAKRDEDGQRLREAVRSDRKSRNKDEKGYIGKSTDETEGGNGKKKPPGAEERMIS